MADFNQIKRLQIRFLITACYLLSNIYLDHNYTNISNLLDLTTLDKRRTMLNLKFIRNYETNLID